ncbi:hypothetical protein NEI02_07725 [Brachyspira pilosicoli]|uniref:Uncharacterized protein n=1 Tax=Brachyspira pilosicoli TaxID=52584 RepID=A0AAJ6KCK7_BRAPL|nr:hypothetical protein [Brachyspira pilosicoli]WIH89593.1 hypothetical protein NEI02_07725 [Brachyspira pilosicoli]WIH91888.1 hypothetical protein NEI01_07725 [Brachyspira pilosicoli]WIH94117.1 hypothetical protein NEH99_07405 [Brachyspira pilosicoli]
MKSTIKFTLLVFFIFSIFSISLFSQLTQWEVNINGDLMFIINADIENDSALGVGLDTSIVDDYLSVYNKDNIAVVLFYSDKIKIKNDYTLRIKKKSNNYITYSVASEDIIKTDDSVYIGIGIDTENGVRANNLIRILLNSVSVELYDDDGLLGYYELDGLQEVLKENLGDTEWYNKEIEN